MAMCQRNIALNSHLLASGGEACWVPTQEGGSSVWQVGQTPRTGAPGGGFPPDRREQTSWPRGPAGVQWLCPSSSLPTPPLRLPPPSPPCRPWGPCRVSPAPCLTTSLPAEHLPGAKSVLLLWLLPPLLTAALSSPAPREPQTHLTCPSFGLGCPLPHRPDHPKEDAADGGAACAHPSLTQTRTGSAGPTDFRPFRDCPLFLEQRPSSFARLDPVGSGLCPLAVPTLPSLQTSWPGWRLGLEACPFHISICCPLVSWDRDVPHETAPWASTRPDA